MAHGKKKLFFMARGKKSLTITDLEGGHWSINPLKYALKWPSFLLNKHYLHLLCLKLNVIEFYNFLHTFQNTVSTITAE
jgi:hypothetical protein